MTETKALDTAETTGKEAEERHYTLRGLQGRDVFALSTIISKMGFRQFKAALNSDTVADAIAAMADEKDGGGDAGLEAVGIEVMMNVAAIVLDNLPKAEQEVYSLLASLSGMTAKEVSELPLADFANMVVDVVLAPDFRDFIKVASRFAK